MRRYIIYLAFYPPGFIYGPAFLIPPVGARHRLPERVKPVPVANFLKTVGKLFNTDEQILDSNSELPDNIFWISVLFQMLLNVV